MNRATSNKRKKEKEEQPENPEQTLDIDSSRLIRCPGCKQDTIGFLFGRGWRCQPCAVKLGWK
jgi:hypothetical protein